MSSDKVPPWLVARLSIGLTDDEIEQLLDLYDSNHEDSPNRERRRHDRVKWRSPRVLCEIDYDGADKPDKFMIVSRNLSRGGMALFHCQLLYPRQPLRIIPPTTQGLRWPLDAQVIRCRPIKSQVYEVGIRFTGIKKGDEILKLR
jgi:hypothetical protein